MISLSSGLLQFVSSANLVTPDSKGTSATLNNGLSQLSSLYNQLQSTTKSQASTSASSSARLADDTYTPSSQSAQSASSSSATASSSTASSDCSPIQGLTADQVAAMDKALTDSGYGDPMGTGEHALYNSMQSGDLSAAKTAYAEYMQALQNPVYQMSPLTTASSTFMDSMASLGTALNSGDMTSAESIYSSSVQYKGPMDIGDAAPLAFAALELDGETKAGSLIAAGKNGSTAGDQSGTSKIEADFQNYDALMQEKATIMSSYLVSQGFSSQEANYYSEYCAQVVLPSGSQSADSSLAKVQTAQYAQALNQFAENYVATKSTYEPNDGQMQDMIVKVLKDTWNNVSQGIALSALNTSKTEYSSSSQTTSSTQ